MNLQKLQILCPYSNARESSSYLKLSFARLYHQEIRSFGASNECKFYLLSQNNRTLKDIVLSPIYAN